MAAAATYTEATISSKASTPATRSGAKRKRDATAITPVRSAPSARRSASQNFAAQHEQETDAAFAGETNASGFDLSALQSHQTPSNAQPQQQPGTNIDTAAAALNYTMPVADSSGSGFQLNADGHDFSMHNSNNNAPATPSNQLANHSGSQSPPLEASASAPLTTPGGMKPAVGSTEWHKVRKDNHKEVERRRRETINEGINELAKIVPGCEKNKGSILQRAVQYIQKLQDDAQANIDKWTFEKLVTEQAINDLSSKLERIQREREMWKGAAEEAGVDVEAIARRVEEDGKDA